MKKVSTFELLKLRFCTEAKIAVKYASFRRKLEVKVCGGISTQTLNVHKIKGVKKMIQELAWYIESGRCAGNAAFQTGGGSSIYQRYGIRKWQVKNKSERQ